MAVEVQLAIHAVAHLHSVGASYSSRPSPLLSPPTTSTETEYSSTLTELVLRVVMAAILVAIIPIFGRFWGRDGTTRSRPGTEPEEPPPPPSPVAPPPVTPVHSEQGSCVLDYDWKRYHFDLDVFPDRVNYDDPSDRYTSVNRFSKTAHVFLKPEGQLLPIRAESNDIHLLVQTCSCPGIDGDLSRKTLKLYANVRYAWEILGEGSFVKISGGPETKSETGGSVIFKPPVVETESTVRIRVTVGHDDSTKPPNHPKIEKVLTLNIAKARRKWIDTDPNSEGPWLYRYSWDLAGDDQDGDPIPEDVLGGCVPEHTWKQNEPIEGRITLLPPSIKPGDFVRLEAFGTDSDDLELGCVPSGASCTLPSEKDFMMSDGPYFQWSADNGTFTNNAYYYPQPALSVSTSGREVVWRAPDNYEGSVAIKLTIYNTRGDYRDEFYDEPLALEQPIDVRRTTAPTAPVTPPPPVAPPPTTTGEEKGCEMKSRSENRPEFACDVEVSKYWPQTAESRDGEFEESDLVQSLKSSITSTKTWDHEGVGTAVAVSEGGTVGGSVDAGAKVWFIGSESYPWNVLGEGARLQATNEIAANSNGKSEIEIEIEAAPDSRTAISAAVLVAGKAKASVIDPSHELFTVTELMEILNKLLELLEKVGTPEEFGDRWLEYREALEELKNLIEAVKVYITEIEQSRAAAKALEWADEIIERFYDSAKEGFIEFVIPYIIEVVGKWYLASANVEVEVEGSVQYTVGNSEPGGTGQLVVSRELEVASGEIEQPPGPVRQYTVARAAHEIGTSTVPNGMKISIDGDCTVRGRAYDGGEGNAYFDSLWAAIWVGCCESAGDELADGAESEDTVQVGYQFNARFTAPKQLLGETEMDEQELSNMIKAKLEVKLRTLIDETGFPCPVDEPREAEETIKYLLTLWFEFVQNELFLFVKDS